MEQQTEYDILKLVENQGRCYVSSDCMPGVLLASCLKYRPSLPREQLLAWMRQILEELEKFHRCRGNPCYQYVNPYSMIAGEDGRIHLLDLSAAGQQELRKKLTRRSVRESFLMPDNQYCQRESLADDIYGIGRTFQYMLAAVETDPPIQGGTKRKLQKIIFRCLSQTPGQEKRGRSRKQYHSVREISEQFPKDRQETKKTRKAMVIAAAAVSFTAVMVITAKDPADKSVQENSKSPQESSEGGAGESPRNSTKAKTEGETEEAAQTADQLKFDMAMLYFLELEDYRESRQLFREAGQDNFLAAGYAELSACMLDADYMDAEELETLLKELQENMPDRTDYRYYLSILRGYGLLEKDEAKEEIIRLGEQLFALRDWTEADRDHEKEKEARWMLAGAFEAAGKPEKSAEQYGYILELEEEEGIREQIYSSLISLCGESGDMEAAWEYCQRGLEELTDSVLLRVQYIRMQCASPETDRQVCAQTIQKFLREVPKIADEPEFKKLQEEYEIKVEGEEVWVGK